MPKIVNISTDPGSDAETISTALANRLKQHRKEQKLSLDELSRRAGVSKGMLVEIEKGNANPSIAILCKLAAALGISVADIVNVASAPSIHVIEQQDIPVLWTGPAGGSARLLRWNQRTGHGRIVALGNAPWRGIYLPWSPAWHI